jgi:hypothetical protein
MSHLTLSVPADAVVRFTVLSGDNVLAIDVCPKASQWTESLEILEEENYTGWKASGDQLRVGATGDTTANCGVQVVSSVDIRDGNRSG